MSSKDSESVIISREEFDDLIAKKRFRALWRLPNESRQCSLGANHILSGIHSGFVISPFLPELSDRYTFTIPANDYSKEYKKYDMDSEHHDFLSHVVEDFPTPFPFPKSSTSKSQHGDAIEIIKVKLDEIADICPHSKVVSATVKVIEHRLDIYKCFQYLCNKYPKAFIFCVYIPESGWMFGATPELLVEKTAGMGKTMALAGTRLTDCPDPWDSKNIEEQAIVRDYIVNTLEKCGYSPYVHELHTRKAGPVEHLCNEITFYEEKSLITHSAGFSKFDSLHSLLNQLSPTPALAGYPKELAIETIKATENFHRGYYGGFLGPVNSEDEFKLYVNLRSGRVSECVNPEGEHEIALFAGGGITRESEIATEQSEVINKLKTLEESLLNA